MLNPKNAMTRIRQRYSAGQDRPLHRYSAVLAAYTGLVGLATAVGRARGVRLPARFSVQDTVLVCLATHKASRLVTKEAVTSPLRAPFTEYQGPTGEAEVNESVPGHGARHTIGELLTCPFCLGVWVASGLTAGLVFAPKATRLVSTALTAVAVSDTLQLVYDRAKPDSDQDSGQDSGQDSDQDSGQGTDQGTAPAARNGDGGANGSGNGVVVQSAERPYGEGSRP